MLCLVMGRHPHPQTFMQHTWEQHNKSGVKINANQSNRRAYLDVFCFNQKNKSDTL